MDSGLLMRLRPFRVILVLLTLATPAAAAPDSKSEPESLYDRAAEALNAKKFSEAQGILSRLMERYPAYYNAHGLYWDTVGHLEDASARRTAVARSLESLAKVPRRRRNDDFYTVFIRGCNILEDQARARAFESEAIRRLPRGVVAQESRLGAATQEKDPLKAVAVYQAYIDDFPENVSWTEMASRFRFGVMVHSPDLFDTEDFLAAAKEFERYSRRFVETYGNPSRNVRAFLQISDALAERSPAESLGYARKGIALVEETWIGTKEFDETERIVFWPVMLRAHKAAGDWSEAVRLGEALVREFDGGTLPIPLLGRIDDAKIRRIYSEALERTGAIEPAREQLWLAKSLDDSMKVDLDGFFARHPMEKVRRKGFEAEMSIRISRRLQSQDARFKKELLATEQRRPAAAFELSDLGGRTVSLADFRHKVLVLSFWATWCGPCVAEMKYMEAAYGKYKLNPRVAFGAVSIDSDKSKVAPYVKEGDYTFPILLTDGKIEEAYGVKPIPQLFVIDPKGQIRFAVTGYPSDGYNPKRLEWMIEAALK